MHSRDSNIPLATAIVNLKHCPLPQQNCGLLLTRLTHFNVFQPGCCRGSPPPPPRSLPHLLVTPPSLLRAVLPPPSPVLTLPVLLSALRPSASYSRPCPAACVRAPLPKQAGLNGQSTAGVPSTELSVMQIHGLSRQSSSIWLK